jgi:anaerobic selenocysteine-containing dehydrogenase
MRFQTLFLFVLLASLLAVGTGSGYGQSQTPAATQQPAATSAPPKPPPAQAASPANAKPAKVWTNDEIDNLPNNHGVSVVGNRAPQNVSANSKGYSLEKDPAWYLRQLAPLRAEIEKLDGRIEQTKAFLSGEKVSEQPASVRAYFTVPGNPQGQLKQMEARRQADAAKVDDLLDLARHNGIEPGALR